MLASFRDVFSDGKPNAAVFPERVVEQLNKHLPEGTCYHSLDDGSLCVGPSGEGEFSIGGFRFEPTSEMVAILGQNPKPDDVLRYSYNAQKPIRMSLSKPGYIMVNGEEVPAERFAISPEYRITFDEGSFFAYPSPFPEPFGLDVETEDERYAKRLNVRRVPAESLDMASFESDENDSLVVRYSIAFERGAGTENKPEMTFNMSVNPGQCASLADVIEVLEIFRAAAVGKIRISGKTLGAPIIGNLRNVADDAFMRWLRKAQDVETALGLQLNPRQVIIDDASAAIIEELYIGIVERKPVRVNLDNASVFIEGDVVDEVRGAIKSGITRSLVLFYQRLRKYILFGEEFSVPSVCGIYQFANGKIEKSSGKTRLVLENNQGESGGFESFLLFENEASLEEYKNANQSGDVMGFLSGAKTAKEYLDEEGEGLNGVSDENAI